MISLPENINFAWSLILGNDLKSRRPFLLGTLPLPYLQFNCEIFDIPQLTHFDPFGPILFSLQKKVY